MPEILVIGGTHGEEKPGIVLVRSLQEDEIPGVEAIIGNPAAVAAGVRSTGENLALAYPGRWTARSYERRLANENIRLCYAYDLVIDVHSCEAPGSHYAVIGEHTSKLVLESIAFMGIRRLIVTRAGTHHTLYRYMPNCFGVELSSDSDLRDLRRMRKMLGALATQPLPEQLPEFAVFADVEDGAITEARAQALDLPDSLPQFAPLESRYAERLGFNSDRPLYAQDWHADAGEYRGVLATNYDFSLLLQSLRTVDDCYDADYLDKPDDSYFYDMTAGAGRL